MDLTEKKWLLRLRVFVKGSGKRRLCGTNCDMPSWRGVMSPRLEIIYCTRCRWLLRASWFAQELLTTFETELGEVALIPGIGGIFEVRLDGELLWSRAERARFPEPKEIKQLVRDRVAPGRSLGHSDEPGKRS
jgi:selenoprotein W-related protein